MKKHILCLVTILSIGTAILGAQESYTYESDHYVVRSAVSAEDAQDMALRLEAYLSHYNRYLHFDLSELKIKMKVRLFADDTRFDQYLTRLISETRADFVYLH